MLKLNYTKTSDKTLELLRGASHLRELTLDHTEVTDLGVAALQSLASLKSLDLYHTQISEDGAKRLAAALPECKIAWQLESAGRRGI